VIHGSFERAQAQLVLNSMEGLVQEEVDPGLWIFRQGQDNHRPFDAGPFDRPVRGRKIRRNRPLEQPLADGRQGRFRSGSVADQPSARSVDEEEGPAQRPAP